MELLEIGDMVDVRLTAPECGLLAEGCEVLAGSIADQGRPADLERLGVLGDVLGDAERTVYLMARLPWADDVPAFRWSAICHKCKAELKDAIEEAIPPGKPEIPRTG